MLLVRHQDHAVEHGLGDQHTIERVLVWPRECPGCPPVREADRQTDKALNNQNARKIGDDRRGTGQLADAEFRRDLPG